MNVVKTLAEDHADKTLNVTSFLIHHSVNVPKVTLVIRLMVVLELLL